jgi:hypothetical protein
LVLTGVNDADDSLRFAFAISSNEAELFSDSHRVGLARALGAATGKQVDVAVNAVALEAGEASEGPLSPVAWQRFLHETRTEQARSLLNDAPGLDRLKSVFGASLLTDSVAYDLTKMKDDPVGSG